MRLFLLLAGLLSACSPKSSTDSADTASPVDTSSDTASPEDTADTEDTEDSEYPIISGDCFVLDDELTDTAPSLFSNAIDFGEQGFDEASLSEDGALLYATDNAGGSSIYSEVFSFELLHHCEDAKLLKRRPRSTTPTVRERSPTCS